MNNTFICVFLISLSRKLNLRWTVSLTEKSHWKNRKISLSCINFPQSFLTFLSCCSQLQKFFDSFRSGAFNFQLLARIVSSLIGRFFFRESQDLLLILFNQTDGGHWQKLTNGRDHVIYTGIRVFSYIWGDYHQWPKEVHYVRRKKGGNRRMPLQNSRSVY